MIALVGYTGFVGSNICAKGNIDRVYNSKNINKAYGLCPDILIYCGLRAEKYLANNSPERDYQQILEAEKNIININPKKLVLISTVDVFKDSYNKDENSFVETEGLHPYGLHRYYLEQWVRENYQDAVIIRLPGLYGLNLKKNFIYDYINVIPFMLKQQKYEELLRKEHSLSEYYVKSDNDFFKCKELDKNNREILKDKFKKLEYTALNFTDSRSIYQFYPLSRLWDDINVIIKNGIKLWHPATEPISVKELYKGLTSGEEFENILGGTPAMYNFKTVYDDLFGGSDGYICTKEEIVKDIKEFVGRNV